MHSSQEKTRETVQSTTRRYFSGVDKSICIDHSRDEYADRQCSRGAGCRGPTKSTGKHSEHRRHLKENRTGQLTSIQAGMQNSSNFWTLATSSRRVSPVPVLNCTDWRETAAQKGVQFSTSYHSMITIEFLITNGRSRLRPLGSVFFHVPISINVGLDFIQYHLFLAFRSALAAVASPWIVLSFFMAMTLWFRHTTHTFRRFDSVPCRICCATVLRPHLPRSVRDSL